MNVVGARLSFCRVCLRAHIFWRSDIRETMLKIMIEPDRGRSQNVRYNTFHDDEEAMLDEYERTHDWESACGDSRRPRDPSSCILWCSIALGALVRGRPIELVSCSALIARTVNKLTAAIRPHSAQSSTPFLPSVRVRRPTHLGKMDFI